jgi:sulfur-oxidizing protein SoxY
MQRRRALAAAGALGAAGFLPSPAQAFNQRAFDAHTVQDAVRALGGTGLAESRDVTIQGPEIAENGAVVPVSLATSLSGIKLLALMAPKNPNTLVATFVVNELVEPAFTTRMKLAETMDVYAVAIATDGKAYFAKRPIQVTLGGCG